MDDSEPSSRADKRKAKNARRRARRRRVERERKVDAMLLTLGSIALRRDYVHDLARDVRRRGWKKSLVLVGACAVFVAACVVIGAVVQKWP